MLDHADELLRERVQEVDPRSIWPDETKDFTPWLAKNLDTLNRRLGLELREPLVEVPIGNVKADILARSADGGVAIVENQLSPSDPKHLGQLLTYVSGREDVSVAIWVASRFKPEHRNALARLNEWSHGGVAFHGAEIAAIRIGDSEIAADFRPIAFPEDWDPHRGRRTLDSSSALRYRSFFGRLMSELTSSDSVQVVARNHKLRRLRWMGDPSCST